MMPLVLAAAFAAPPAVTEPCTLPDTHTPLQVYVVSVTPGWDAMSSLGHTMVLFAGGGLSEPVTYNWGAFDASSETVMRDFASGELPYFLVEWSWPAMHQSLLEQGRGAVGQRLALDDAEARAFMERLEHDPARDGYIYDWATANCSTKARDAIDEEFDGALAKAWAKPVSTTPRYDVRRHLGAFVARDLAWSFIAGPEVDVPLTAWERTMFPERLLEALEGAKQADGARVVDQTCVLLPGRFQWAPERPAPTWLWSIPGLLAGWMALAAMMGKGRTAQRLLGSATVLYGLFLTGLGGSTLLVSMLTAMKGAGPTWAWALAGPQSVVLVVGGVQAWRGRSAGPWMKISLGTVLVASLVGASLAASGLGAAFVPGILGCVIGLWRGPLSARAQSHS